MGRERETRSEGDVKERPIDCIITVVGEAIFVRLPQSPHSCRLRPIGSVLSLLFYRHLLSVELLADTV